MTESRPPDPNDEASTVDASTASRSAGYKRIGRYTVRRVIAAGATGTVYEAEQDDPHRTVALKVLRRGVASPSMLARSGSGSGSGGEVIPMRQSQYAIGPGNH